MIKNYLPFFLYGMALAMASQATAAQAQDGKDALPPLQKERVSYEQLKARMAESAAKHPLLHKRLMPTQNLGRKDSLVRLNRMAQPSQGRTAMASKPRVVGVAASGAKNLWGNVLYDSTWGDEYTAYGMYTFPTTAPVTVTSKFTDDYFRATGSGAWVENTLYYVWYQNFWGIDMYYLYKWNTDTWEQEGTEVSLSDCSLVANETAVAKDGTVYGDFLDADGTNNELGIADYENKTRSTIGRLKQAYVAMGITSDNILYGIGIDGGLYKIDTATATETFIGSTGVTLTKADGSYYYQSGEIDQSDNTFYWASVDANQKATLYTVDLSTGQLSLVGDFTGNNIVAMLTVVQPLAADGAPAAATNLTFDFQGGSLTGDVCFKAPSATFNGASLSGELTYYVVADKDTLATGRTTAGADVRSQVTLKKGGQTSFIVTTANAEGSSPKLVGQYFAGFDVPKASESVVTTIDTATGKATVAWTAPTEGMNGGYVGELKYDVVRYPEGTTVATAISGTTFEETLPKAETQVFGYGITPVNGNARGEEQVSNYVAYGDPITPPFLIGFDEEYEMAYFTNLDGNGDGKQWTFDEPRWANDFDGCIKTERSETGDASDWFITPALDLKAGHRYKVSFRISGQSKYYPQKLEVKYGAQPNAEGMTETLMPVETFEISDFTTKSFLLEPKADQVTYIGFHDVSEKGQWGIKLDDISVSAGVALAAPDSVTNLKVTPAAKGELKATLSFTAPTLTTEGKPLSEITKFLVRRTGKVVGEIAAAAPGASVTYTDDTATNGINIYSIAASNSEGTSFYCQPVPVYVGLDAPTTPIKKPTVDNISSVTLNWETPETGQYGGYVKPDDVTYFISTREGESDWYAVYTPIDSVKGQTSYTFNQRTDEGSTQEVQTYHVCAQNKYGTSSYVTLPSFVTGKPYSIPFSASVKNYMFYGVLWTTWSEGTSDFSLSTESVDNDGGSFMATSVKATDTAYLGSGKIALDGATAPKLMFHHKAEAGSNAKITVEVELPDGTTEVVETFDYANFTGGQWNASAVDLSKYASLPYISFDFAVQADAYQDVYIDRLFVRDTYQYDLNAEVSAPETMKKGETAKVAVRVNNFGEKDARRYSVSLYAGGELVEKRDVTETLAAYRFADFEFDYKSNILSQDASVELKAVVDYANDLNEDDNAASTMVAYETSNKPKPEAVSAEATAEGVKVEWTPVSSTKQTITDSFEDYTSWSCDLFGDWTSKANNAGTTGGPFSNRNYPNQGSSYGFILADPLTNWLTDDELKNQVPGFAAHTGYKYLASYYRADDEGSYINQDNWLISPELSGDKQTVTFYVKNENDGSTTYPETFDVLYSTTDKAEASFTKLGDSHTTSKGEWEEVSVDLPAGAKYFAIHHTTTALNAFVFMVDDVTYTYGAGDVKGYNVYRDGKLVASVDATATSVSDAQIKADDTESHTYGVTAVYEDAESEATLASPIIPAGIDGVVADGKLFDAYTTDGKLVGKNLRSTNLLKKGVYVVNGKKVIVK